MKTWLKVLIVIVLMACASGATCFVFYNNLENDKKVDLTITNYLTSSERTIFNEALMTAKTNCNDERMDLICVTLDNFEEILQEENYYLINYNSKIKKKHEIKKKFETLKGRKDQLYTMLIEYNIKCENASSFDKHIGANDLYVSFANFFKEYSDFIQLINTKVYNAIISENADLKFSVIELYTLVVKDSFSVIIVDSDLKTIQNTENIDIMNKLIEFESGQMPTKTAYFSSNSAFFINNYHLCNKNSFAKNLSDNLDSIGTNIADMTTIELATYYFKEIFEI